MIESTDERITKMVGDAGYAELLAAHVGVVGIGLLGGAASTHIGVLGPALTLVDPGRVDAANLTNQGFPATRLGAAKVDVRARQIRALRPKARIRKLRASVERVGLGVFAGLQLLIGGLDGRAARVRLAEISALLEIPWVDLAVDGSGERQLGTVSYYDPRDDAAPCYACKYSDDEFDRIRTEGRGPGCPKPGDPEMPATPPTLQSSAFGALVAGWGSSIAIGALLGRPPMPSGTCLRISADDPARLEHLTLGRSSRCKLPHQALGPLVHVPAGTVGELFDRARADLGSRPRSLRLHHRIFSESLYCTTHGGSLHKPRLIEAYEPTDFQCKCREGALRIPRQHRDHLTERDGVRCRGLRWSKLGLPKGDVVTAVARDGAEIHYVVGSA